MEARREKRRLREALQAILAEPVSNKDVTKMLRDMGIEDKVSWSTAICIALVRKAMSGDVKAYEVIRDTIGEKPVDHFTVYDADPQIIDEVERMVRGEGFDESDQTDTATASRLSGDENSGDGGGL